jgi:C_GCAxxG_C_C family probable redox protein
MDMEKTLEGTSYGIASNTSNSTIKRLGWGFLGGLVGTLVMDVLLMGALLALGQPAWMCFSIVGDTVSRFLAIFGAQIAGGISTGVVTHYVVGPLFGILFGAFVTSLPALIGASLKKTTLAAFIYVEVLSQPILATTPILLKMKTPATLVWFGGSFVMHLMLSIVLGVIVGYGLRSAPLVARKECKMQYDLSTHMEASYRARSLDNLLRMGHCAPAVMKTVLDINQTTREDLVKLMGAMPGGIGNTGYECGGITSSLVILGLRSGLRNMQDGLPLIFDQGHAYFRHFCNENGAPFCKDIQNPRLPVGCIHAVRHSPEILAETIESNHRPSIPAEPRQAYSCLYGAMNQCNFHCAHEVFHQLGDTIPVNQELLDATSAFMGGTLFKGLTCSAYTAGVMAIGLKIGEIENNYLRVARMLALMVSGGKPFGDDLNKFNRAINTGHRLSKWFRNEFGSTQCKTITQCDFSCKGGVDSYIAGNGVTKCRRIARMVAEQVQIILQSVE